MSGPAAACHYHHRTPAVAGCAACGRPVCGLCTRTVNAASLCSGCAVGRATQLPWLAGLFSLLLPGAGQVYNGDFAKAVVVLLTAPLLVPWLWGVADAVQCASAIAAGRRGGDTVPTGPVLLLLKILWLPVAVLYGLLVAGAVAALAALAAGVLAA